MLRQAPSYTPRPYELADLELLLSGAYTPLTGFLGRADLSSLSRRGRLVDGTPWPVPVTLEVPRPLAEDIDITNPLRRVVLITDTEGAPIAALDAIELWQTSKDMYGVAGPIRQVGDGGSGPFQRLRATPKEVKAELPQGRVLGVIADRPLHRPQLAQIARAARTLAAYLVIFVPVAAPGPGGLAPEALVRCVLAARARMPDGMIVVLPLPTYRDEIRTAMLHARVAAAYGVTHLLSPAHDTIVSSGSVRVLVPRDVAYDGRDGQWRCLDDIPPRYRRMPLSSAEIGDFLDRGAPLPEWHTPPAVARELAHARPSRRRRGLVLFFTGLSGSGKSTIARGVSDNLLESGERTVTLLDGDIVRRHISARLGYSVEDKDTNVRNIGWAAAEIAKHGALVLCCPIAPYEQSRAAARTYATAAGAGFVLVHVSTPLEECERRDRKGLYAKARAGILEGMTGVHEPYTPPADAELTIDTTRLPIGEAAGTVLGFLAKNGWIDPRRI